MPCYIPCFRHRSAHFAPASCSCRMPIICSSENLVRFIVCPLVRPESSSNWRKFLGAGQSREAEPLIRPELLIFRGLVCTTVGGCWILLSIRKFQECHSSLKYYWHWHSPAIAAILPRPKSPSIGPEYMPSSASRVCMARASVSGQPSLVRASNDRSPFCSASI